MGRLQRKKNFKIKPKKKASIDKSGLPLEKQNDTTKYSAPVASAKSDAKSRHISGRKKAITKSNAEPGKLKSLLDKSIQFLREVKIELLKVTWPTRKQTLGSTAVVVVLVLIISFFLGLVDIGLSGLIRIVLQ